MSGAVCAPPKPDPVLQLRQLSAGGQAPGGQGGPRGEEGGDPVGAGQRPGFRGPGLGGVGHNGQTGHTGKWALLPAGQAEGSELHCVCAQFINLYSISFWARWA